MKTTIKVGKYNIGWIGDNFQKHFGNVKVSPKKTKFEFRTLEKDMLDKEILEQFKPEETTLDEFVYALKNEDLLKNEYANIFYIRDSENTLLAVNAYRYSANRYWHVLAFSVESPDGWDGDYRVLSRKFGSGTLENLELPDELIVNNVKYKRV